MRTRIAGIAVVLVMVLVGAPLFAGGSQEGGDRPFIGVSVPSADHGWTGAVIDCAEAAPEMCDVDGRVLTAADVNKQSNDVEDLIA